MMTLVNGKIMESVSCEICGVSDEQELSTRDRDGKYLKTVLCKQCGLVYTNPRPASPEIEEYYKHSYRLDYKGTCKPNMKHTLRAAKAANKRIQKIQEYIFPDMKALDIGSGGGEMVYAMRLAGADCRGLEPNEGYALYARDVLGLPISIDCIENATLPENYYDIVTMYHVIEHVYSPLRILCNIHSCLKHGGILVIECPNIEAHCQGPSNRFHRAHLYNFNEITLQALAEKAGFRKVEISVSSDSGNILAIFRKTHITSTIPDLHFNFERVMSAYTTHTNLNYYLSFYPYKKLIDKGMRILNETLLTLFVQDRVALLKMPFKKPLPSHLCKCEGLPATSHEMRRKWSYRKALAGLLASAMIIFLFLWTIHSVSDHSDEIMNLIKKHQDGNDFFAVMHHKRLKNISPTTEVMVFNHKDEVRTVLAKIYSNAKNDLHIIVEDDHLHNIQEIVETASLKTVQVISLGSNNYHLLTTETHY